MEEKTFRLDCDSSQTSVSAACSDPHVIIYIEEHHQKMCLEQYSVFNQRNMH